GVIGDDGRIYVSRNGTAEPLFGLPAIPPGGLDAPIATPGNIQTATINVTGQLKYTVDLTPFNVDPSSLQSPTYANVFFSDDVIYGGQGNDALHGGAGDDAISGAEALATAYTQNAGGAVVSITRSDFFHPYNVGNLLRFNPVDVDAKKFDKTMRA